MNEKTLEHIAIASNNEFESDKFFIELLGFEKIRTFTVSAELIEKFFGISKEHKILRYEKGSLSFEVFITNDKSRSNDIFTHSCLLIENRDEFVIKAKSMGFEAIKVPRKDSDNYYLFIKDNFHNLYEIKEKV
ncbi:MAG: VOC family protein [Candidatus Hermodarchaeota archaeon]